jgi:hypothetical protein
MLPSYTGRFVLMSKLLPDWVPWAERHDYVWNNTDPNGWLEIPPPRNREEAVAADARAAQIDGPHMRHFAIHPETDRAIRLTLQRLRADGIPTAMIMMPEASWFRDLLPMKADAILQQYLAGLEREFGFPIIDARTWCDDAQFRDGHHLLATGAAHFTERFGRDIVPLLIGETR